MTADEIKSLINSPNFYDRYDKSKNWDFLGVMAGRAMQSAEFNVIQHMLEDKIKSIGNALYSDGAIIEGCAISYDTANKLVKLEAGKVFLDGLVYEIESAQLSIPDDIENIQVGVWKISQCVTEAQDNTLFDPAKGTPQYHMPGGYRIITNAIWGLSCDGNDAPFFPVYGLSGDETVTQLQTELNPEYLDALARYDNHSNGHYVVNGLYVTALDSDIPGKQVYTISEGEAHINGYEAYLSHSVRLIADEDPNLADVKAEAHPFNAETGGTATIAISHIPMEELQRVLITKERTVTLTHGGYTGCVDELPNTSVFEIVDLYQGSLHYIQNTDFHFANDKINWSLEGEEPAPYSTYTIIYRYRSEVSADSYDTENITITGAVQNSLVELDYTYRMPRIDLIVMYKDSKIDIVHGVAHRYSPVVPATPPGAICLAQVYQNWDGLPEVVNIAVQRVPVDTLNSMRKQIQDLYSLVARNEQRFDAMINAPTSAYNVFVDPLFDDDMRDKGIEQNAMIADNMLQLTIDTNILSIDLPTEKTLDYSHEILINQPQHTKSMQINPYQNFEPLPVVVELNPAVDRWSDSVIKNIYTGSGNAARLAAQSISEEETQANLRQINVSIYGSGFGPNEAVKVIFDGVEVACTTTNADDDGVFQGVFTIPANIPSGVKLVELQGTYTSGNAYFTGIHTTQTTVRTYARYYYNPDPLAQSFTLTSSRHVSGVDFWLDNKGSSEIRVQIRETDNGYPTGNILAETRLENSALTKNSWNRAVFDTPIFLTAGVEYAFSLMTNTADHTVGLAELGDFDSNSGWVRSQAYSAGVLFSSSNASTWTPHQSADLAFRLLGANFTGDSKIISLGTYDLTGVTDVMPLAEVESTNSNTYVTFILKQNDTEIARMQAWQSIAFNTILSGEYTLEAQLEGDTTHSPILGRYPQLVTGQLNILGDYVSRAFTCGQNKKIMVAMDEYKTYGSEIEVYVQTNSPLDGEEIVWEPTSVTTQTELGDGWVRRTRFINCDAATSRIKIILHGSASARPLVKTISAVVLDA